MVSKDLNARTRLEAPGHVVRVVALEGVAKAVADIPADAVVVDLDEVGADAIEAARNAGARRIVAFFSHVNAELGRAAEAAGAEVYPRGRFWRSLPEILS